MSQNICNICGANYEYINGRWKCPACGAYKAEELSNEEVTLLYNAATRLRVQDFIEAEELYLDIIKKYPKQHEAYWGYVCSRYGVKMEVDFDGKQIPTCCFPSIESFTKDRYFKKAVEYSPAEMSSWYKEQASYIERVRAEWIEKAKKETPYDIFISYKDSDKENGIDRTEDSVNALELYNHLARQGYNVFYSRESLRDKIGEKYEPYIFQALKTAKIMIVYASSVEYINSTWVKNEWHRYLKQIESGEKREGSLLVVCDGFSPNELPKILSSKQCLDGKSKKLYVDIDSYLKKVFSKTAEKEEPKKQIKVDPLHEHRYVDEVVSASCIAKGYTIHRCNCGYEYKDSFTSLAEHTYEYKTTKKPTCTAEGYKEFVCSECGDSKRETIPAMGHVFDKWIEQTRPTCTQKGKAIRQCKVCGYVEEKDLPILNHEWGNIEYRETNDGRGIQYVVCKLCGQEKIIKTDWVDNIKREKAKRKKKILVGLIIGLVLLIAISINVVSNIIKQNTPEPPYSYTTSPLGQIIIQELNDDSLIENGVLVIPEKIDGKRVYAIKGINSNDVETLVIPETIDVVYKSVFSGMPNLKKIEYLGSISQWKEFGLDSEMKNYSFTHTGDCEYNSWSYPDNYDCEAGGSTTQTCNYCSKVSEKTIPPVAHQETVIGAVNATCTKTGLTEGSRCSVCNKITKEQAVIEKVPHTEVVDNEVPATCTKTGLTEGTHCSVCKTVIRKQTVTDKTPHIEVIDQAVPATCTQTGLTEGSHCSVCNITIKSQTLEPLSDHSLQIWTTVYEATCIYYGEEEQKCRNCDYTEYREVNPLGHNFSGSKCSVCSVPKPSTGFEFTLDESGYYYILSDVGTCTDSNMVLPDFYNGKPVCEIGESAFWGVANLEYVYIPDSIMEIGDYAFAHCTNLKKLEVPEYVFSLGAAMLTGCTSIEELKIPDITNGYIGYIFEDGTQTGYTYHDDNVPASLKKITVTSIYTLYERAFAYCDDVETIVLPDTLLYIENSAFSGCDMLKNIVLPNSLTEIGNYAFSDCDALVDITIPSSVLSIGEGAFKNCSDLKNVYWGNNCKVTTLGDDAFYGCWSINKFTIPKSVISIGSYFLANCPYVTELIFEEPNGWSVKKSIYDEESISIPTKGLQTNSTALNYFTETYESYMWNRSISSSEKSNLQCYINSSNWSGFVNAANGLTATFMSDLSFTNNQKKSFYDFLIGRIEFDSCISDFCWEFDEDEQYFLLISDYADAYNIVQLDEVFSRIGDYSYAENSTMALFSSNISEIKALWATEYIRNLLISDDYIYFFMTGYWRDSSSYSSYIRFYHEYDDAATWMEYESLPFPTEEYDYWDIEDGELLLMDTNDNLVAKAYKITFNSADEIEIYCYSDSSTKTLTRSSY